MEQRGNHRNLEAAKAQEETEQEPCQRVDRRPEICRPFRISTMQASFPELGFRHQQETHK